MGAGVVGIEVLETESPTKCIIGQTTPIACEYYWNGGAGVNPVEGYLTLDTTGLASSMTPVFKVGGETATQIWASESDIPITLEIQNASNATPGFSEIQVRLLNADGTIYATDSWSLESLTSDNYLTITSGDNGKIVRTGSVLMDDEHIVAFSYYDAGSENDAGSTMTLSLVGLPTGITYQFKNASGTNITTFTLPGEIVASIPMTVVLTGSSTMIAPLVSNINIRVHKSGAIQPHLSTQYFDVYSYGEVFDLATTGAYFALGTNGNDWHGTVYTNDNSTWVFPLVWKYWSGSNPGNPLQLTVNGLPTGVTATFHTDSGGTSSAVTSFGGMASDDYVWIKLVIANNATAVNCDPFTIRGVVSGKYDHSIPCIISIEDEFQISVSISPSNTLPITAGTTEKYTITAIRETPNCSGTVFIFPEHYGVDGALTDGHSFNWSTGQAEVVVNQHVAISSVDYEITPNIESTDQQFRTTFQCTVQSHTEGDLDEDIQV